MAEMLSPGVFVEEVPSQVQVVQSVSTSNLGIVGFTARGPADTATLVTSFEEFQRVFGGFVRDSYLPLNVAAFFANGGRRCYIVRVTPSDATSADCQIRSQVTDQQVEVGTGAQTAFTKTASTSTLRDNTGASPIVSGSLTMRWRAAGTPVLAQDTRDIANGADLAQVPSQASYTGRINPTSLTGAYSGGVLIDPQQFAVVPGTCTLSWNPDGGGVRTIAIGAGTGDGRVVTTTANGQGSVVTLDHTTGIFSVKFAGTDVPGAMGVGDIQMAFTPTAATVTITQVGGTLTGSALSVAGTVSITDGSYSFTTTAPATPHNLAPLLATYQIVAWDLNPVSKGKWGNDLKVEVTGDTDYYSTSTATYSRHSVKVYLKNTNGVYEVAESYDELVFNDATSDVFFPDVINELSDLITVNEPGGNEAPGQLNGHARSYAIAGGDELAGSQVITTTLLSGPIQPRSLTITYYRASDNTLRTITDNGAGALTGHIDSTGTNTINYTTGALALKTLETIRGATVVSVSYRTAPAETAHTEVFGDTTKSYTAGSDGTFTSVTYGRNQFSVSTLSATYQGIYALNRIEEIMQVAVPDFAGDATVTGDLLDFADARAALPSGGDRFVILTVPKGTSAQGAVDWLRFTLARNCKFAALYWPWVNVADPLSNNRPLTIPPLGHVAGIYARTDASKNVGKSPGGTVDGALKFLTGLEMNPTQGERDLVYPAKINPLINTPQTGLAVWGVRTIAQEEEWRYINARRLFMFLEKSIYNATSWIVFENNGTALWGKIKAQLNGYLSSLFSEGYFAGTTPSDAYFVIVDESNNLGPSIAAGQVIVDIGVATNKPAEFVRLRFQQLTLT